MLPNVILIAGPAGDCKTTMAKLVGDKPGWVALSEDEFWNRLPREPHTFRTDVVDAGNACRYEFHRLRRSATTDSVLR
jgi:uridine kinase